MYERFYVPAIFGPLARLVRDAAQPLPGERLLDLACGTGIVARTFAPALRPGGRITAVDLRPGMLAAAEALPAPEDTPIAWRQGDATSLELPDRSFDVVVCQQGLQFFPDRAAALREMRRVLETGGWAVIACWQPLERQEMFAAMADIERRHLEALGLDTSDIGTPFSLGDADELRTLLEAAGFTRVAVRAASIDTDFPASGFIGNVECAYSAVVPEFAANHSAFAAFAAAVEEDMQAVLAPLTRGGRIGFTMRTNIATASA